MKSEQEIKKALEQLEADMKSYPSMTYKQGIELALEWVLGDIEEIDEDTAFFQ